MNELLESKESELERAKWTQKLLRSFGIHRKLDDLLHQAKVDEIEMYD